MHLVQFGMLLVIALFKFQYKGELECVWCSILKNFECPVKIKGRDYIFLNIWSNMSKQRTFDWYHIQTFIIWWDSPFKRDYSTRTLNRPHLSPWLITSASNVLYIICKFQLESLKTTNNNSNKQQEPLTITNSNEP